MAINRFSKERRPAEFNPLSADEIMRVPLLKGQMEQEQLKAIEDKRLELLNVDVAPGDIERVREEQARMSGQFDDLVGRITTEGVGHRTTDAVNKFMRDYNTTTSKSGIIGNAAQFAASRKTRREEDRKLAIAKGYDMAQWDKLYQAHEGRQSSIDAEGNLTSEFQNLNLPAYIDPKKMFRDLIKGKLGSTKVGTTLGEYEASNLAQLQAAGDQVMNAYYNDPDFRQVMDDLGYTEEDLQKQVANEAAIALEESFIEYQQAPLTAAQRAAQLEKEKKREDEYNKEQARKGETLLGEHKVGITEASSNLTSTKELEELKAGAGESDDAMDKYLRAVQKNAEVEDAFLNDPNNAVVKKQLDTAIKAFTGAGDQAVAPEYSGTFDEVAAYAEENLMKTELDLFDPSQAGRSGIIAETEAKDAPTTKVDNSVIVQKPDGSYAVYAKDNEKVAALVQAKELYDSAFEDFSGPNMLHSQRTFFSPAGVGVGGTGKDTNTPALNKMHSDLQNIIKGPSGDMEVTQMIGSYLDKDGNVVEEIKDLGVDDNAAKARRKLQGLTSTQLNAADIKFALDTDTRPGAVKVTFTVDEVTEEGGDKPVPVQYTVTMDMLGDETSEWGIFLSQGLAAANTNQTTKLVKKREERRQQKDVIPTPKHVKGYGNSDEIVDYIKGGRAGKRILASAGDNKLNVYTDRDENNRQVFSIRAQNAGVGAADYTVTNENVLQGYNMAKAEEIYKGNIDLWAWLLNKYSTEKKIDPSKFTNDDPDFVTWRLNLQAGDGAVEHFEATSKAELLNILKK